MISYFCFAALEKEEATQMVAEDVAFHSSIVKKLFSIGKVFAR